MRRDTQRRNDQAHGIGRRQAIALKLVLAVLLGTTGLTVESRAQDEGFLVSTYSLPAAARKGGSGAVYTCPGSANARGGVAAPVGYVQCDGGLRALKESRSSGRRSSPARRRRSRASAHELWLIVRSASD